MDGGEWDENGPFAGKDHRVERQGEPRLSHKKTIREIVERHRASIMKMPGVVGIAVGRSPTDPDRSCIIVYLTSHKRPPGLPGELDGYPVEIETKSKGFRAF